MRYLEGPVDSPLSFVIAVFPDHIISSRSVRAIRGKGLEVVSHTGRYTSTHWFLGVRTNLASCAAQWPGKQAGKISGVTCGAMSIFCWLDSPRAGYSESREHCRVGWKRDGVLGNVHRQKNKRREKKKGLKLKTIVVKRFLILRLQPILGKYFF